MGVYMYILLSPPPRLPFNNSQQLGQKKQPFFTQGADGIRLQLCLLQGIKSFTGSGTFWGFGTNVDEAVVTFVPPGKKNNGDPYGFQLKYTPEI